MKKFERMFGKWLLDRAGKMIGSKSVNEDHASTEIMRLILGGIFLDGVLIGVVLALIFGLLGVGIGQLL